MNCTFITPEYKRQTATTTYTNQQNINKMKSFFSQNWVIATMVAAVLLVTCYIAFGHKADDAKKDPESDQQQA